VSVYGKSVENLARAKLTARIFDGRTRGAHHTSSGASRNTAMQHTPTLHSSEDFSFPERHHHQPFPGMRTPLSRSGSGGHRVNRKYLSTDGREEGGRAMGPPDGVTLLSARVLFDRRGRTCRRSPATNQLLRFAANSTVETASRPVGEALRRGAVLESAALGSPAIGEVRAPARRHQCCDTVRECMGLICTP
jgi:hypothetical protein